jgi:hypothetical protein
MSPSAHRRLGLQDQVERRPRIGRRLDHRSVDPIEGVMADLALAREQQRVG